jgi:hypothetical protein
MIRTGSGHRAFARILVPSMLLAVVLGFVPAAADFGSCTFYTYAVVGPPPIHPELGETLCDTGVFCPGDCQFTATMRLKGMGVLTGSMSMSFPTGETATVGCGPAVTGPFIGECFASVSGAIAGPASVGVITLRCSVTGLVAAGVFGECELFS